jgi:hypothetical protein
MKNIVVALMVIFNVSIHAELLNDINLFIVKDVNKVNLAAPLVGDDKSVVEMTSSKVKINATAQKGDIIIIQFTSNNKLQDPIAAGLEEIRLYTYTRNIDLYTSSKEEEKTTMKELLRFEKKFDKDIIENVGHNEVLTLQLTYNSNGKSNKIFRKILFQRYIQPYNEIGLWVPVGLFSSNFKNNANGWAFSPLPIALAVGLKFNFNTMYIGSSPFINWIVQNKTDSSFNVGGLTIGMLFDINDYLYLGAGFGANLSTKSSTDKIIFAIGPGVKLLKYIKGN